MSERHSNNDRSTPVMDNMKIRVTEGGSGKVHCTHKEVAAPLLRQMTEPLEELVIFIVKMSESMILILLNLHEFPGLLVIVP